MGVIPSSSWLLLAACILVGLLNEISGSVLILAMPNAAHDIGASREAAQFILLAGKLSLGALILAGGGVGDRFGRNRIMLLGIALVALAALLSAAARSAGMLVGARILDGVGNAMVGPLALALAIASFPKDMRARVIGLFLGISGAGVAIGPLAASFLVQWGGWRVGFAAPFILALLGGVAIAFLIGPQHAEPRRPPWDPVGMLLCIAGLVMLVLSFVLAGALAGLGTFAWWETSRAAVPLLDPALLRSREVLVALTTAVLAAIVLNGTLLPLFYFLQRVHGYGPVAAVIHILPLVLAAMAVAPMAGGMAERHGRRMVMLSGMVAMAAGAALMAMLTPATGYGMIAISLMLIGGGTMGAVTPAADLVMATSGAERSGSAAALNGAVMQIGGAIGIGFLTPTFLAKALQDFAARMVARGYSRDEVVEPARRLVDAVRESTLDKVPHLPDIPVQMQRDLVDAYAQAFATGVAHTYVVAGGVALVGCLLVLAGMRGQVADRQAPPVRP